MILVTGATGSLGTQIIRHVLNTGGTVAAMVRAPLHQVERRLSRAWWDWPELISELGARIQAVPGDVSAPDLGLSSAAMAMLKGTVTHVVHAAADIRLNASLDELRCTNCDGTARMLALARALPRLSRFLHVSTAYVAGCRRGPVGEDDLSDADGFRGPYELSKYEAELMVRQAMAALPVTIVRPSMVVGDSRSGAIKTFNTIYYPLRLYLTGHLSVVPVNPSRPMHLVPSDYVACASARLLFDPLAEGRSVHLVASPSQTPTVAQFFHEVRRWGQRYYRLRLPRPLFVPVPLPSFLARYRPGDPPRGRLGAVLPYLNESLHFRRENADQFLGSYPHEWRGSLPALLDFAVSRGFLHRSERTVHEQVMYRLGRSSRPIRLHDIIKGRVKTCANRELHEDVQAARKSLYALGIRPGDRVAMIGRNSSRYLTVDVAVGLAGAVNVPLYPTTPVDEARALILASNARILFANLEGSSGAPDRIGIPLVSLDDDPAPPGSDVMTWKAFIATGVNVDEAPPVVVPGDPATLRHSSGTTGYPQAVVFDHRNLRWLAECLAALLPWKSRTVQARYLSFLPPSHVVEGILAMYAPYYLPAPVDIYFLPDFGELPRALALARPTVFFSVPRFFEKLWEVFCATAMGRWYVKGAHHPAKAVVRPLLRHGLLRRAGLDRCGYLIAGSAPSDAGLLGSLHDLGIEVHEAYGLTEAPLVTLNRHGRNRIGTVGEPLPETEVSIIEGEIWVRGPQVARGRGMSGDTTPNAWLRTGDLGSMTDDGFLVIDGREREVIATSYGKKISLAKVEAMLRTVPGVAHAMLVGECRPFCAALLWTDAIVGEQVRRAIDDGIAVVNARLARPERVRRWAVLPGQLSMQRGELTANQKLRRAEITRRCAAVIDDLYRGSETIEGALHTGTWVEERTAR